MTGEDWGGFNSLVGTKMRRIGQPATMDWLLGPPCCCFPPKGRWTRWVFGTWSTGRTDTDGLED